MINNWNSIKIYHDYPEGPVPGSLIIMSTGICIKYIIEFFLRNIISRES